MPDALEPIQHIYNVTANLRELVFTAMRPAWPPCSTPTLMASRQSRGWVRWGARFRVSALAKSRMGSASPRGSSLSVLQTQSHVFSIPHHILIKLSAGMTKQHEYIKC